MTAFDIAGILLITWTAFDLALRLWVYSKTHDERIKHELLWFRYYY